MFGEGGKVHMEIENIKSTGSFFMRPIKTRINKGANALFGFFIFASILILFNERSKGLKKIVIFL